MKEEDFIDHIVGKINDFIRGNDVESSREKSQLVRRLFDKVIENLQKQSEDTFLSVQAPNVVIEVVDEKTGILFRRYLEIDYIENNYGLKITGETLEGENTHIAFLSNDAINRLHELKGSGFNEPRCK